MSRERPVPHAKRVFRPLDLSAFPPGARTDLSVPLSQDSLGRAEAVPFIVVRGATPGPVLGISAAVHGDELNGIRIIHRLLDRVDPATLRGTLLCAPVANVPSFKAGQRHFPEDLVDLNHVFPGKRDGKPSEQYAYAFRKTFLEAVDYLVDIHTASEGRINSFYVRADLHSPAAREMARLLAPEIVLHGRSGDGTLRGAARRGDKPAITLEAGNPDQFQGKIARRGLYGMTELMEALGMIDEAPASKTPAPPVICSESRWLRTRSGGLLQLDVDLTDRVEKGQEIGKVLSTFGHLEESLKAPADGVVIGRSRSPLAVPGTRYCHLGTVGEPRPPKAPLEGRMARPLRESRGS